MGKPVMHFEILGKDGAKLQDFYGKLFDWSIDSNNPFNYGSVETGAGQGINGGIASTPEASEQGVSIYVQVDDLQAYLDRAVELGGTVVMPPMDVGDIVKIAVFNDPEGNRFGLMTAMAGS